ncbi:MAG: ATP-binding protein, partial [bacterium]
MIASFLLKFGRSPGVAAESITAPPVTVFVGPNNSGKSQALREIERYCRTGRKDAGDVLLADVT